MPELPRLEDDQIIYRTLTKASQFKAGRVFAPSFHRRANDDDGVSVDYNVAADPVQCGTGLELSSKRAIVQLSVGSARDSEFGLDVIPDTETHANITNIPFYDDESQRERAEQIANLLVERRQVAWQK